MDEYHPQWQYRYKHFWLATHVSYSSAKQVDWTDAHTTWHTHPLNSSSLTHTSIWINRNLKSSFAINLFYCFFFGCSFLICVRFYYVTLVFIEFNFGKWEKININFIHREFHEQKLWAKFDFSVTVMPGKKHQLWVMLLWKMFAVNPIKESIPPSINGLSSEIFRVYSSMFLIYSRGIFFLLKIQLFWNDFFYENLLKNSLLSRWNPIKNIYKNFELFCSAGIWTYFDYFFTIFVVIMMRQKRYFLVYLNIHKFYEPWTF